ncbi:MAG: hypothetical protein AAF609_05905 [Cyanobacteria bacterium P01_C01_bin.120]
MEAFALLFVIGLFIALISPEIKGKKPSAGDDLVKSLKAVAVEINKEIKKGGGGDGDKKSKSSFWTSPWAVMLYTIVLGIVLTSF